MSAVPNLTAEQIARVASDQWLRRVSLIVSDETGSGLDLSQLRIKFHVEQADLSVWRPNTAQITIYNLSDKTLQKLLEFTQVTLQAGYQPPGRFGIIFQGVIKAFERGHESVTESFLTIFAADGDLARFAVTNVTMPPGWTADDEAQHHLDALEAQGIARGTGLAGGTGGIATNFNGKLLYGPTTGALDRLGKANGWTWQIVHGQFQRVPLTGYLPGEAVQLNARTGLIGWPSNTPQGLNVTCLLNPAIRLCGLIQINNKDINATQPAPGAGLPGFPNSVFGFPSFTAQTFYATVANDGFYRVMVLEYEGDTRGNPWYCHLVCLAADISAPAGQSVPIIAPTAPGTPG